MTAGAFALISVAYPSWGATTLGMPSPGYVYFHKQGADLASHNEAVEGCAIESAKTMSPIIPGYSAPATSVGNVLGNVVGAMILGGTQSEITHANFVANIENCMVVSGWEVVQLNELEGKAVSKLDRAAQATALAPWVGASDTHGTVIRRYESIELLDRDTAGFGQSARDSLSVTSDAIGIVEHAKLLPANLLYGEGWGDRLTQIAAADPKKIAANSAVIVIRGITPKPPNTWVDLVYLGPNGDIPEGRTTYLRLELPTKPFWVSGTQEKIAAYPVPAGRWAIADISTGGFCLSTPAFDVASGEAIFAGTFNAQALFKPDLSADSARQGLGDSWIGQNLKQAVYRNGQKFSCERFPQTLLYKLEIGAQ